MVFNEYMSIQQHINGIQHIGIPTNDIAATEKFLASLGFEEAFSKVNNGTSVKFFRLGDVCVETYENHKAAMMPGAVDHIALDVDDIEKTLAEVTALGYVPIEGEIRMLPFWENGVRFFTIMGPNKEKVEFSQML